MPSYTPAKKSYSRNGRPRKLANEPRCSPITGYARLVGRTQTESTRSPVGTERARPKEKSSYLRAEGTAPRATRATASSPYAMGSLCRSARLLEAAEEKSRIDEDECQRVLHRARTRALIIPIREPDIGICRRDAIA